MNKVKTIAVVGISENPERASFRVAKYLQECGLKVIPVNPTVDVVLGEKSYPDILSIPRELKIDLIDIFRKPDAVKPIVEQAVSRGDVKIVWMQEGIINEEAAGLAEEAGLKVIMDKCLMKEYKNLL